MAAVTAKLNKWAVGGLTGLVMTLATAWASYVNIQLGTLVSRQRELEQRVVQVETLQGHVVKSLDNLRELIVRMEEKLDRLIEREARK